MILYAIVSAVIGVGLLLIYEIFPFAIILTLAKICGVIVIVLIVLQILSIILDF